LYVEDGFLVFCLSRSKPDIELENFIHIQCDVSDYQMVRAAFETVSEYTKTIDVLVNNAGIGTGGSIEHTSFEDAKKIIDVNLLGIFNVTQIFLPLVRETKGKIINISSVAAHFAIPYQTLYSATKAAMNAFSNGLRNEVRTFGVKVMTIMPADINTNFMRLRNTCDGVYQEYANNSIAIMERDERKGMTPHYVAKRIFKLQRRKKLPQQKVISRQHAFLVFTSRFFSIITLNFLLFRMFGGKKKK